MTSEQVMQNALNTNNANSVKRELTEKQANAIIDRAREIDREMRRLSRSYAKQKAKEIEECWDMWYYGEA